MSAPSSWPQWIPVFPLPDVVLFPRQVIPLHIFEPRYRQMVADAVCGDGLIAIALLKSGYEETYFTSLAAIHKVVGVGKIISAERLDDGRYHLLLRGAARAQIVREDHERAYRRAATRPCPRECGLDGEERIAYRERLWKAVTTGCICPGISSDALSRLFEAEIPVGGLVDLLAGGAPIDCEIRQSLLEELDEKKRADQLLESLSVLNAVRAAQQARRGAAAYHPN